jgi:hypothetical protein
MGWIMGVGYRLDHSVPPFWHRSDKAQYLNLTPFAGERRDVASDLDQLNLGV